MYDLHGNMINVSLKRPCSHCGGSGVELSPVKIGNHMRSMREKAKISLRSVASKLGISPPYLSDLERGNRCFSEEMIARYKEALK